MRCGGRMTALLADTPAPLLLRDLTSLKPVRLLTITLLVTCGIDQFAAATPPPLPISVGLWAMTLLVMVACAELTHATPPPSLPCWWYISLCTPSGPAVALLMIVLLAMVGAA